MASLDNFKPVGGVQVRTHELSGPSLPNGLNIGRPTGQYVQPILPQQQIVQQQPVQQGAIFGGGGPQNMPKGAQPVPLAGSQPGNLAPRLPMSPQAAPALGQKAPPGQEVHVIKVHLEGPDGKPLSAEWEVVAPRGSKVLGVTEVEPS